MQFDRNDLSHFLSGGKTSLPEGKGCKFQMKYRNLLALPIFAICDALSCSGAHAESQTVPPHTDIGNWKLEAVDDGGENQYCQINTNVGDSGQFRLLVSNYYVAIVLVEPSWQKISLRASNGTFSFDDGNKIDLTSHINQKFDEFEVTTDKVKPFIHQLTVGREMKISLPDPINQTWNVSLDKMSPAITELDRCAQERKFVGLPEPFTQANDSQPVASNGNTIVSNSPAAAQPSTNAPISPAAQQAGGVQSSADAGTPPSQGESKWTVKGIDNRPSGGRATCSMFVQSGPHIMEIETNGMMMGVFPADTNFNFSHLVNLTAVPFTLKFDNGNEVQFWGRINSMQSVFLDSHDGGMNKADFFRNLMNNRTARLSIPSMHYQWDIDLAGSVPAFRNCRNALGITIWAG